MSEQAPVVEDMDVKVENKADAPEAPKVSPAQDLRTIQMLLLEGSFAGKYSMAVANSFKLLDAMAAQVERDASKK